MRDDYVMVLHSLLRTTTKVFLRDDYTGLSQEQEDALFKAYKQIIIEYLGTPRPGGRIKREPDGIGSTGFPAWKGFVYPKELTQKITDGLTEILHPDKGMPSGLKIPGYSNLP